MTAGPTRPKRAEILHYCYLFAHEADKSRTEGAKDRPILVINTDGNRYIVAAITTKGERNPDAIAIPENVARAANIAPGSSVVVSEVNVFDWPGFDIRPFTSKAGWVFGRMTPGFFNKIITELESRRPRVVHRS